MILKFTIRMLNFCLLLSSTISTISLSIRLPDVILQVQTFGICVSACECVCMCMFKWPWKLLCVDNCQHTVDFIVSLIHHTIETTAKKRTSSGDTMCWFFQLKCGDGDKLHMRSCVCVFAIYANVSVSQLFVNTVPFHQTHTHTHMNYAWGRMCVCVVEAQQRERKRERKKEKNERPMVTLLIQQKCSTVIVKCGCLELKSREREREREKNAQPKCYFK